MKDDDAFEDCAFPVPPLCDLEVVEILLGYADALIAGFSSRQLRELRRRCQAQLPETEARAMLLGVIDRRLAPNAPPPANGRN